MQLSPNTEVLKEPRGFIKFIEIILAICAFATAVDPHIKATFKCCSNEYYLSLTYPYWVGETNANKTVCPCSVSSTVPSSTIATTSVTGESTSTSVTPTPVVTPKPELAQTEFQLPDECKSSSEFYVFVGVTAFLFSLAVVTFYVFAHEQYAGLGIIPKADFVMTLIFTLFWLISSSAFAAALSKIKYATDPSSFQQCYSESGCITSQEGNYSTLNASVLFGFLNMVVWAGNNWFLYKETNWFGTDTSSTLPPPTSTSEVQPKV